MSAWDDATLDAMLEEVMRRAALDPEFRALALTDAVAAIQRFMPDVVPGSLLVSFVENAANSTAQLMAEGNDGSRVYVLPAPMWELSEIVEGELEEVAGGACQAYSCTYTTCGQNSCVAVSNCNNCCAPATCPFTCFCGTNGGGCCVSCILTWS